MRSIRRALRPVHLALPHLALLLPLLVSGAAGAQDKAGVSAAVRGEVELTRESQQVVGRQVESGENIFLRDVIESGDRSGMQILLLDETVFTIGPDSAIVIDEFVYDPATDAGQVSAEVVKGVFRFVSGKVAKSDPDAMTVKLPVGNIGVRGTRVAGVGEPGVRALAVLLGPGDENDGGESPGAFVANNAGKSEDVATPGWGVEMFPGMGPNVLKVDPAVIAQILGMLNNPEGVDWSQLPAALQWLGEARVERLRDPVLRELETKTLREDLYDDTTDAVQTEQPERQDTRDSPDISDGFNNY